MSGGGPAGSFREPRRCARGASGSAPATGTGIRALLYVGAGVWEELVFRLCLLGGFVWLTTRVLQGNVAVFSVLGILLSSVAFSGFHHVGELADPFTPGLFLYRLLVGVALSAVFVLRGLAVCVYTHAFYNVGLLLVGALDG